MYHVNISHCTIMQNVSHVEYITFYYTNVSTFSVKGKMAEVFASSLVHLKQ